MKNNNRRDFLKLTGSLAVTIPLFSFSDLKIQQNNRNRILIRTGWRTDSYGDLASIPAVYRSIQRFVPNTEVILWPFSRNETLNSLLESNFTQINFVNGTINDKGEPSTEDLKKAFESAHLFLYVPGPQKKIDWTGNEADGIETTSIEYCIANNVPYVVYGIGEIPETTEAQSAMNDKLNRANLTFITDSRTEDILKDLKIKINNLRMSPDIIFAFDLKNDVDARKYLSDLGLTNQTYIIINIYTNFDNVPPIDTSIGKIVNLIENWILRTGHNILMVPEKSADVNILNTVYSQLSDPAKEKTKIFTGDISPDLISSIIEKSRITTGMSPSLLFSAIQADIPIFHYSEWGSSNERQSFLDVGLKSCVVNLEVITDNEFFDGLSEIDHKYVKALLETNKSNEVTITKLQQSFDNIHRQLLKINPVIKEKKKTKNK